MRKVLIFIRLNLLHICAKISDTSLNILCYLECKLYEVLIRKSRLEVWEEHATPVISLLLTTLKCIL